MLLTALWIHVSYAILTMLMDYRLLTQTLSTSEAADLKITQLLVSLMQVEEVLLSMPAVYSSVSTMSLYINSVSETLLTGGGLQLFNSSARFTGPVVFRNGTAQAGGSPLLDAPLIFNQNSN